MSHRATGSALRAMRSLSFLLAGALLVACGGEIRPLDSASASPAPKAASVGCWSDCQCPLGEYCDGSGECSNIDFSPHYPDSACFASCQCPHFSDTCTFQGNYYGACEPPVSRGCQSDCDCGSSATCNRRTGQCTVDFGPFPECRCDKHCPNNERCIQGSCR